MGSVEQRYYTAETLEAELRGFEAQFGMSSAAFYALHERNVAPEDISGFDRFVWADTYRETCRLTALRDLPDTSTTEAGRFADLRVRPARR